MHRLFMLCLICIGLTACPSLPTQKPEVTLVNVTPQSATFFEQSFVVKLRIQNPNEKPFTADGIAFQLSLNGEKLGQGVSNSKIDVPAYGEGEVDVTVRTTLASWLKQFGSKGMRRGNMPYEISGHLNGLQGIGAIPFRKRGELKL